MSRLPTSHRWIKSHFEPPKNMYNQSSTEDVGQRFENRKRTPIACRSCRKRKTICQVDLTGYQTPCYRCARLGLTCEYLAVADDPEASSSSYAGPSESSPTESEYSTAYLLNDLRASYHYGSPTQPDSATAHVTSDLVHGTSEMVDPAMSVPFYHHGWVQPALSLGNFPVFPQPDHYIPRPIPESVVYEAASMQTFMALSPASSMSQRTRDIPNQRSILQQMYQLSSQCCYCHSQACKCNIFGEY
ncbi:hypothetical protein C8J56DRAFT_963591 [Mycena floridula]|nr:hypothetical protein C8J56DRAFT_963591 [Mycena floridula]